ncbi:hypothetical protein MVEN_01231300 [Mycena venus]|uniref:Uncharacterized protein n=1 Tax=Mycena venus TaxID=2733690 RepID=A0A8H6Y681_9AGAR|nr:hypothetical protein MVEN_01231300 [Mycena venus]
MHIDLRRQISFSSLSLCPQVNSPMPSIQTMPAFETLPLCLHTLLQRCSPLSPRIFPTASELELAISEPLAQQPSSSTSNSTLVSPRTRPHPSPGAITAVQELVTLVASTKQAAEIERTRRMAWEQEQEAKYVQRQAEMERQMLDMRNEIAQLRGLLNANRGSPVYTPYSGSPAIANLRHPAPRPASPISPVSQPSSHSQQQQFVQGSSRMQPSYPTLSDALQDPMVIPRPVTPSSSLRDDSEAPSSATRSRSRKRRRSVLSDDESGGSVSDTSSSCSRPRRTDHHDKRILTIQRAIRAHILLCMDLPNDKHLPESHAEGEPLEPPNPVRFVWDKTTKQSAHNGRMKLRVLEDFRARRRLYKHVPDKEFSKKVVDSAFEQSFTTFRQKFRTQRDVMAASRHREREDSKARKSRHTARRKTKLSNRADARIKLDASFAQVGFDGAMQIECMSSEESDFDPTDASVDLSAYPRGSGPLQTRGYGWRSTRLLRFYAVLDDEDAADAETRPRRGVGRRERFVGPHKEGFHMPPKGVASWMISRRWIAAAQVELPDLGNALGGIVVDAPGFDLTRFVELGPETDDEEGMAQGHALPPPELQLQLQQLQQLPLHHYSTSSLHCALA